MNRGILRLTLFVAVCLCAAQVRAQYFNVDNQTLPGGPIKLEGASITPIGGGYTLSGLAVNHGGQTYHDVKLLDEWMFDNAPSAYQYQGTGLWTSATSGGVWQLATPDGYLAASAVSPLPFSWTSGVFAAPAAFVAPGDSLPYITIGDLAPGASAPFSETISTNIGAHFDFVGSFISTTAVPEPSTVALACLGIAATAVITRKRQQSS